MRPLRMCGRRLRIFLIAGLVVSMIQWPDGAHAQSDVLVLTAPDLPVVRKVVEALNQRAIVANAAGRSGGRVEVRTLAQGQTVAALAQEALPQLHRYRAVFATSMGLARAVQKHNDQIPIVFVGEADPVQMCLADSMQRPGRNATGYMDYLPDDDVKMMEALVYAFPHLQTLYLMVAGSSYYVPDCGPNGRIVKPARPPCVAGLREFDQSLEWLQQTPAALQQARQLGVKIKFMLLCAPEDFTRLATVEPGRRDIGFVFAYQGLYVRHARQLIAQVSASGRPAVFGRRMFATLGGVLALEPILDASDDRVAIDMLLQVLDGRAPATLPVQVPRGFRLTVNAAAAEAQGLRLSLGVLRRADEVIADAPR